MISVCYGEIVFENLKREEVEITNKSLHEIPSKRCGESGINGSQRQMMREGALISSA